MALPNKVISDFEKITNYALTNYLSLFVDFIVNDRSNVIDYYSGKSQSPSVQSFDNLNLMVSESLKVEGIIEGNKSSFTDARFWELVETLSEIRTSILTIDNSSKWLRSSISKGNYNPQVEVDRVLRQFQTLEKLSEDLGSANKDSDWVNIALRNDLEEEDYSTFGGNVLKVSGLNRSAIRLRTVVDNISGKKIYGLDIDRKLSFKDNDLSVLSYDDTMKQSVEVLARLTKGSTPEFPDDGAQLSLMAGVSKKNISYPILIRQYTNTFQKDDTLKSLKISKVQVQGNSLKLSFEVQTRLGETLEETSSI